MTETAAGGIAAAATTGPATPSSSSIRDLHLPVPMVNVEDSVIGSEPAEDSVITNSQVNEMDAKLARPIPFRTSTLRGAFSPLLSLGNSLRPSRSQPQSPQFRPRLFRNQTSQSVDISWSKLRKDCGSSGCSPSQGSTESFSRQSSGATTPSIFTFSRSSSFLKRQGTVSVPDSPELRALLKSPVVPNLNAVNRALNDVKRIPGDDNGKVPYVESLTRLAIELETVSSNCKAKLCRAMLARSEGKPEVCRGMCVDIVNNAHSEVATKVYALNILATQSSPGQATRYLKNSSELIKSHMKQNPGFEQLLGVVNTLKASALSREVGHDDNIMPKKTSSDHESGEVVDNTGLEMPVQTRMEGKWLPRLGTLRPKTLVDLIHEYLSDRTAGV